MPLHEPVLNLFASAIRRQRSVREPTVAGLLEEFASNSASRRSSLFSLQKREEFLQWCKSLPKPWG